MSARRAPFQEAVAAPPCAGPDPNPRSPSYVLPPDACDCHSHIFGPLLRFPYASTRSYTPPEASLAAYLQMLDILGLARAVLVQPSVYGDDNGCLLDGLAKSPRRLRGVVVIDPRELGDRTIAEWSAKGVRGVRMNTWTPGGLPLDEIESIAARLAEIGWHLDLITDTCERLAETEHRLRALPCEVVIEQMGRIKGDQPITTPGFRALLRLLDHGRCWVKLSHAYHISTAGPPYGDTISPARALVAVAPERLVWGSDWPHPMLHGPMPNDGSLVDLLAAWVPDETQRRAVLVDNPARLYGFP
jgi:2-pyrone-4,6-dicarboxylate lactonase